MSAATIGDSFHAGGPLAIDASSYVERPADAELPRLILAGELCYVLTARQMGKSSLMLRAVRALRDRGVRCSHFQLDELGTDLSAGQWYRSMLRILGRDLDLSCNTDAWWAAHDGLTPAARFGTFLEECILEEIVGHVAIFIDEVDTARLLPFADDFFAAIRAAYNRRAEVPAFRRLSFVFLGVAAPADLIRAPERTPFNVGQAIELGYLSRNDAEPLEHGLAPLAAGQEVALLDRIFWWTSGHPYQTQRLCLALTEQGAPLQDVDVDAAVERIFFGSGLPDSSMAKIEEQVAARPDQEEVLQLYAQLLAGRSVAEDRRSLLQTRLQLIGLARYDAGRLVPNNRIFSRAFDPAWVRRMRPSLLQRRVSAFFVGVMVLTIILLVVFIMSQQQAAIDAQRRAYLAATDPSVKAATLAGGLCPLRREGEEAAQALFFAESPATRRAIAQRRRDLGTEGRTTFQQCICPGITVETVEHQPEREKLRNLLVCPRTNTTP